MMTIVLKNKNVIENITSRILIVVRTRACRVTMDRNKTMNKNCC